MKATEVDDPGLAPGPSLSLDDAAQARDYDQISATWQFVAGQFLVDELAIKAGERVLDVGCAQVFWRNISPTGQALPVMCWGSTRCRCASILRLRERARD